MLVHRAEYRLCYAHRVWDHSYSYDNRCRMIHGHTADLSLVIECDQQKTQRKDVDAVINKVLGFLDERVFNRMIIDYADPMFYTLVASLYESLCQEMNKKVDSIFVPVTLPGSDKVVAHVVDLSQFSHLTDSPVLDILQSYFIVNFCPSTGNLAKWLYDISSDHFKEINVTLANTEWSSVPNRKTIHTP